MTPADGEDRRDKRIGIRLPPGARPDLEAMYDWAATLGVPVRQWARGHLCDAAGISDDIRRRVPRRSNTQPRETTTVQDPFQVHVSAREREAIKKAADGNVSEWSWGVLVAALRHETRQQRKEGQQR